MIFKSILPLSILLLSIEHAESQSNLTVFSDKLVDTLIRDPMAYIKQIKRQALLNYMKQFHYDTIESVPRIIGGTPAAPGEAPFQVQLYSRSGSTISFHCGGSLISSLTVLTAGHCIRFYWDYRIRYGTNQRNPVNPPYPLAQISNIKLHPNFNIDTITNDLALIILKRPIGPSANVAAIGIQPTNVPAQTQVTVYGFGLTNGNDQNSLSNTLQKADLRVVNEQRCRDFIASVGLVKTPGHLCVIAANRGTCNGDSGGPLVVRSSGLQTGIVSFGIEGCPPGAIDVLTNVPYYYDWIRSNMEGGPVQPVTTTTTTQAPSCDCDCEVCCL